MSPQDPFYFKRFHKLDLRRLGYTVYVRGAEVISRMCFLRYQIRELAVDGGVQECPDFAFDETAVTKTQMQLLIDSVQATEAFGGAVVEVGAFRGVTTAILAERTSRKYFAVDPYIGYGGAETDMVAMLKRIQRLNNVQHLRLTSGEAIQQVRVTPLSFVFVDAVHDYVNAHFDGVSWGKLICPQGMLAFHDTDSRHFPGVQRVVWNLLKKKDDYELFGHVHGLVVLRKWPGSH
ncbi:MAG TPA: hypothetical protein DCQ92_04500 [Verrucomicrobia subdivision 3 bacterium]|nr:hypothetical protein [Limisphaerales bacterium]